MLEPQLILCLRSYTDWDTQDTLGLLVQRMGGWFEIRNDCVDYFVQKGRHQMLYLIDPALVRQPHLDCVK